MIIIPHSPDVNLARIPWVTLAVVVLSLLIHAAQENSRSKVLDSAGEYCDEVFSGPDRGNDVYWNYVGDCAKELAGLRSLPNPELFLKVPDNASKYFPGVEQEGIDQYYSILNYHYDSFALIAPRSLDAALKYDPAVPNPWRMITSNLAHADWWHVIVNIIVFFAFASLIELMAGRIRFIILMLFIAFVESLTYSLAMVFSAWPLATYGLSGVVFGMIGLMAYVAPRVRIRVFIWFVFYVRNHSIPAWVLAVWFIGWNIWNLLTDSGYSSTNFIAHVSGAFAGYYVGRLLMKEQRKEYADTINEEIESQRGKRGDILRSNVHIPGNYQSIIAKQEAQARGSEYESILAGVYLSVKSGNDSAATMTLLNDYDLWSSTPEVYEEIFNRIKEWGTSRTLFCIGRLVIHLSAKQGLSAKAQYIASQCLELNPDFVLADSLDMGNMLRDGVSVEARGMIRQLQLNTI